MFFVDKDLKDLIERKEIEIIVDDENPPFNSLDQIGPSTIDFRLGRVFRRIKPGTNIIDLSEEAETEIIKLPLDGHLTIYPGELILGLTVEEIKVPANISGFISVRSSIARLGLSVVEQPFIHPGYEGSIALQLRNNIDHPIRIKPLVAICQVMFLPGTGSAERPYGSNDTGKYFKEAIVPKTSQLGVELDENRQAENVSIDFAFVTVLDKELDAILSCLDSYEIVRIDSDILTYYRGRINISTTKDYYEVVVVRSLEMGTGEASIASTLVINRWHPKHIIMVGIAGGVRDKVTLGDVVIADVVLYYELAKITSEGDQRRDRYFYSDRLLYDRANSYKGNAWKSEISAKRPNMLYTGNDFPRAHTGTIASGEKIIADAEALAQLRKASPELLAVAMEGAGVARAASHQSPTVPFLEVRGISDYADGQKNDDWQEFAAEAAAKFTISLLRSRPVPSANQRK